MTRTRLSLYYLAGYLLLGGFLLLFFPREGLHLLLSTGDYGDVLAPIAVKRCVDVGLPLTTGRSHRSAQGPGRANSGTRPTLTISSPVVSRPSAGRRLRWLFRACRPRWGGSLGAARIRACHRSSSRGPFGTSRAALWRRVDPGARAGTIDLGRRDVVTRESLEIHLTKSVQQSGTSSCARFVGPLPVSLAPGVPLCVGAVVVAEP
jgi:hypothetical protein